MEEDAGFRFEFVDDDEIMDESGAEGHPTRPAVKKATDPPAVHAYLPSRLLDMQSMLDEHAGPILVESVRIATDSATDSHSATDSATESHSATDSATDSPSSTLTIYRRNLQDITLAIGQRDNASDGVTQAFHARSDLIPAVYEGGLKTWECSMDLLCFLRGKSEHVHGRVLELGCGAGLPGAYCLSVDAVTRVDFQDYNEEVLRMVTYPNARLNGVAASALLVNDGDKNKVASSTTADFFDCDLAELPLNPRIGDFYAGDWDTLPATISSSVPSSTATTPRYDLLLTAETIYRPESYPKLAHVFSKLLALPHGVALVAAKSYYFGCGGTMRDFVAFLEAYTFVAGQEEGEGYGDDTHEFGFACETCAVSGGTSGVHREIVKVSVRRVDLDMGDNVLEAR